MSQDWAPGFTRSTARQAALLRWSREPNARAATQAARDAFLGRFLAAVDPDGQLEAGERQRRAEQARRAHMLMLAQASVEARRRKGGQS